MHVCYNKLLPPLSHHLDFSSDTHATYTSYVTEVFADVIFAVHAMWLSSIILKMPIKTANPINQQLHIEQTPLYSQTVQLIMMLFNYTHYSGQNQCWDPECQ